MKKKIVLAVVVPCLVIGMVLAVRDWTLRHQEVVQEAMEQAFNISNLEGDRLGDTSEETPVTEAEPVKEAESVTEAPAKQTEKPDGKSSSAAIKNHSHKDEKEDLNDPGTADNEPDDELNEYPWEIEADRESDPEIKAANEEGSEKADVDIEELPDEYPCIRLCNYATVLGVGESFIPLAYLGGLYDDTDSYEELYNKIEITGSVDTQKPGMYVVTYHTTDSKGLTSNEAVLKVKVVK